MREEGEEGREGGRMEGGREDGGRGREGGRRKGDRER